jgi:hypothetical protein
MTTNQAIALLFPLLTVAVLWILAVAIRRKVERRRIARSNTVQATVFAVSREQAMIGETFGASFTDRAAAVQADLQEVNRLVNRARDSLSTTAR